MITTDSLRQHGHASGIAYQATCPHCGQSCTTHSTSGQTVEEIASDCNGYGYWHTGCRESPPSDKLQWHQV